MQILIYSRQYGQRDYRWWSCCTITIHWLNEWGNIPIFIDIWRFPEIGVPPVIIHFSRIFPYKPSILGIPHLWKPPYPIGALGSSKNGSKQHGHRHQESGLICFQSSELPQQYSMICSVLRKPVDPELIRFWFLKWGGIPLNHPLSSIIIHQKIGFSMKIRKFSPSSYWGYPAIGNLDLESPLSSMSGSRIGLGTVPC